MADPITAMRAIADRLDRGGWEYAFVGGAVVNLLLDRPELSEARPTDDVDVILGLAANARYSDVEVRMRSLGFDHDMREDAPKCRWLLGSVIVDLMPTDGAAMGLNTRCFAEALATASEKVVRGDVVLRIVSPPAFLALKLLAFADRGDRDFYGSHDLEDALTVVDGRKEIAGEVAATLPALRNYVRDTISALLTVRDFQDAMAGALGGDEASQARLPTLREKLRRIAEIAK